MQANLKFFKNVSNLFLRFLNYFFQAPTMLFCVSQIFFAFSEFFWWWPKIGKKTKVVVWDAIRTARKPEKMFWTAGIAIYRLVMSKGSHGKGKISKWSVCFWISGSVCQRNIVDGRFFWALVSAGALKVQISLSQISFRSTFDQKSLRLFLLIFQFCKKFGIRKKRIKNLRFAKNVQKNLRFAQK